MDAGLVTKPFQPFATAQLSAGAASASVTFTGDSANAPHVLITNESTVVIYIAFGKTTATAVVPTSTPAKSATPIGAGAIVTLYKGPENDTVAVIAASGSSNKIDITCGIGN